MVINTQDTNYSFKGMVINTQDTKLQQYTQKRCLIKQKLVGLS